MFSFVNQSHDLKKSTSLLKQWHLNRFSCIGIRYAKLLNAQNPCSNHEIHALFEHGFYLTNPIWTLICLHNVTGESVAAMADHFADALNRENVACVNDVVATL